MFRSKKKKPRVSEAITEIRKLKAMLEKETKMIRKTNGHDLSEDETTDMTQVIDELLKEDNNDL